MSATQRKGVDHRIIKALGHEWRVQALELLNRHGVMSPKEIAGEIGIDVPLLSHHIKVLVQCQCIELVDTQPRRGAVEHFYRATAQAFFSEDDWPELPASVRSSISGMMWGTIVPEVSEALRAGTFDLREDRHLTWDTMHVDEEGWGEIRDYMAAAFTGIQEAKAKSAERLAASGGESTKIATAMLGFQAPKAT